MTWYTYRLVPSTGKTKELSANNCKEIKEALSTDCTKSPQSGVYWVQNQQVTSYMHRYDGDYNTVPINIAMCIMHFTSMCRHVHVLGKSNMRLLSTCK